jgi:hypothetical protein
MIGTSLISSEINERYFGESLFAFFDVDLHDCVGPGGVSIGGILRSNSEGTSFFDNIKEFIRRINGFFLKTNYVNIGVFIFSYLELSSVSQEIK